MFTCRKMANAKQQLASLANSSGPSQKDRIEKYASLQLTLLTWYGGNIFTVCGNISASQAHFLDGMTELRTGNKRRKDTGIAHSTKKIFSDELNYECIICWNKNVGSSLFSHYTLTLNLNPNPLSVTVAKSRSRCGAKMDLSQNVFREHLEVATEVDFRDLSSRPLQQAYENAHQP